MKIRKWQCYLVINCAVVYCALAKPFSLNEVIAAESQQKQVQSPLPPKLEASSTASERFSLNKYLKKSPLKTKKFKETDLFTFIKSNSPLKYKKAFQIKSPIKPRRIKPILSRRNKRKNSSRKREISGNEKLNDKYIPLLRNLGMLVADILGGDTSESLELEKRRQRYRQLLEPDSKASCSCPTTKSTQDESVEETVTLSEAVSDEIEVETSTETPHTTAPIHIRRFRHSKNVPFLLPRHTLSFRRRDHRLGQRNSASHYGSAQKYISGDYGTSEYNSRDGEDQAGAERDDEDTNRDTQDDAGGVGHGRDRVRGARGSPPRNKTQADSTEGSYENDEPKTAPTNAMDNLRGNNNEHKRQNKLEIGRNETKSAIFLPKPRRLRGKLSKDEIDIFESIQSEENYKESDVPRLEHNISGNQQVIDRSRPFTKEIEKTDERNETVVTKEFITKEGRKQGPVVVIIDGYSVTRNKNGENKLSEKSVHIQSK